MFDEDKYMESEDLMRSILSQGQEEVPERIWEGISSELDRIEAVSGHRTVTLWFRRSAVAVAAAAAVAIGVFADWSADGRKTAPLCRGEPPADGGCQRLVYRLCAAVPGRNFAPGGRIIPSAGHPICEDIGLRRVSYLP